MSILFYFLTAFLGAVIALGTYIYVRKLTLNGRKEEIIQKAEVEAEKIKKEGRNNPESRSRGGEDKIGENPPGQREIHPAQE